MNPTRILIVEDQAIVARDLATRLHGLGYDQIDTAGTADEALALAATRRPDVVLMDIHLPGGRDGVEAAVLIREQHGSPIVFLTAYAEEATLQRAKAAKPSGYIIKPFEDRELRATIEVALHQHSMEQRLRESEESLRLLYQGMTQGVVLHDSSGLVVDCNPAAERLLGVPAAELRQRSFQDPRWMALREDGSPLPGNDHPAMVALRTGVEMRDFVIGLWNPRVEARRWLSMTTVPQFRPGESTPWRVFTTFHDITEPKRLAGALRESEARYRQLVESTPDAIVVHVEGRLVFVNPAATQLLGARSSQELLGRLVFEFLEPSSRAMAIERARQVLAGGSVGIRETRVVRLDGTTVDIETIPVAIRYEGQPAIQLTARDITWRKQAEAALRDSESSYRGLFNTVRLGIYIQNAAGRFLDVNDGAASMYGYAREELIGQSPEFVAAPGRNDLGAVAEMVRRAFAGEPQQFEFWGRRKNGEIFPKDVRLCRGTYFGQTVLIAIAADITEAKRLEEQLRQSQKIEAIGRLAGGIAHDFNNVLAAMMIQIGLLKMNLAGDATNLAEVQQLDEIAERGSALVRQLLMFGRRSALQIARLDLNEVIGDLMEMLTRLLGETITLTFEPAPGLPAIQGDSAMLQQVLVNLCVNARDAMPDGGRLIIQTAPPPATTSASASSTQPAECVCLVVRDTGHGLDETTRAHLFEPFFNSKHVSKGNGIGLATAYSVVQQHRGWIDVESAPGKGTTFRVFLPVIAATPATAARRSSHASPIRGGSETLLLVEDNDALRRTLGAYLRHLGYTILDAADGASALTVWQDQAPSIALVVTDMVMPGGINGLELIRRIRLQSPGLRAIVTSGYSAELSDAGPTRHDVFFLAKPYPPPELAAAIRRCIDGELAPVPPRNA